MIEMTRRAFVLLACVATAGGSAPAQDQPASVPLRSCGPALPYDPALDRASAWSIAASSVVSSSGL
jgi:hypothetical protein